MLVAAVVQSTIQVTQVPLRGRLAVPAAVVEVLMDPQGLLAVHQTLVVEVAVEHINQELHGLVVLVVLALSFLNM
jgi:hypothetical protein